MLGSYLQPVPTESATKAHYIIFPPWISVQDKNIQVPWKVYFEMAE